MNILSSLGMTRNTLFDISLLLAEQWTPSQISYEKIDKLSIENYLKSQRMKNCSYNYAWTVCKKILKLVATSTYNLKPKFLVPTNITYDWLLISMTSQNTVTVNVSSTRKQHTP